MDRITEIAALESRYNLLLSRGIHNKNIAAKILRRIRKLKNENKNTL